MENNTGALIVFMMFRMLIVIPAIVFHEFAHGKTADMMGDHTARFAGRLTLNPLAHIDPFGTVMLPILLIMSGMPAFGYAKPVPVNPNNFIDRRKGMAISGASGPLANFTLAATAGALLRIIRMMGDPGGYGVSLLMIFAEVNIWLGVFNLLPVPPLDGSRVLAYFMPGKYEYYFHELERYGIIILFTVFFLFPNLVWSLLSPLFGIISKLLIGG